MLQGNHGHDIRNACNQKEMRRKNGEEENV